MTASTDLKMTVYSSLFVALIAVGAFIAIPIGPVPIVLQNMFVLLAGLLLGPLWGLACVAVYLIIGLAGLPVFAGGTSGLGKLFGPTGGYLLGYLPCVFITASVSRGLGKKPVFDILAMVLGSLVVYSAGVPWLKAVTGMSLEKALMAGMVPFLIGDALKIVAAAFLAKALRPLMK
ncbi:MAG: BioY family transporter [Desulfobacula sp. RIFOXYA12_FULL_46_16]|nr:MAG: BioY family transporter [Deltaproteobacteria bacterium RIFOXYC2_FULL_48_10]OGR20476.1 MAG: BioY family transporter [Desulfobacula sp. RIFOXYA12_FULL_46_16]OGR38713.1 MAG: BioY family transporter [Desulfobacula sp. RIFOXYB2_FULL_45_6]